MSCVGISFLLVWMNKTKGITHCRGSLFFNFRVELIEGGTFKNVLIISCIDFLKWH